MKIADYLSPITLSDLKENQEIELSPGTDQWMSGDRFGRVVRIDEKKGMAIVLMERSGRKLKCQPDHIYKIF